MRRAFNGTGAATRPDIPIYVIRLRHYTGFNLAAHCASSSSHIKGKPSLIHIILHMAVNPNEDTELWVIDFCAPSTKFTDLQ